MPIEISARIAFLKKIHLFYGLEDDALLDLAQAIEAARLALDPYPTASFGIDIVGVQYQGVAAEPVAVWRETQNMAENGDVLAGSAGLGVENEGVVAVTVVYSYEPPFSGVFAGNVEMEEVTYARGRTPPFVARE